MYKIIALKTNVTELKNIICAELRYMPYKIQHTNAVQYVMYIVLDRPETFFVFISFIVWGKKARVVNPPDKYPNISPTNEFMMKKLPFRHIFYQ